MNRFFHDDFPKLEVIDYQHLYQKIIESDIYNETHSIVFQNGDQIGSEEIVQPVKWLFPFLNGLLIPTVWKSDLSDLTSFHHRYKNIADSVGSSRLFVFFS